MSISLSCSALVASKYNIAKLWSPLMQYRQLQIYSAGSLRNLSLRGIRVGSKLVCHALWGTVHQHMMNCETDAKINLKKVVDNRLYIFRL
jgi:hypothetical protein